MHGPATNLKKRVSLTEKGHRNGFLRQITESMICLALAVILFRNFQIEGYMVTTGSMAPNLLGFHKRVTCPNCGELFAFGVAFDESVPTATVKTPALIPTEGVKGNSNNSSIIFSELAEPSTPYVSCPNCGQDSINISKVPKNHGDHLLVHKNAYQFRPPKRWEVVVFRNPRKPTEAYVKRAIGLSGENVRIYQGDVLIDGKITRKDLPTQKALRIPVYNFDHQPQQEKDPVPRWITSSKDSLWKRTNEGFTFTPNKNNPEEPERDWLIYRHRIRSGGNHRVKVKLPNSLQDWGSYQDHLDQLVYDSLNKELICIGVLSLQNHKKLISTYPNEEMELAFTQLYEESHFSPITDFYGYNRMIAKKVSNPVRDIMLSAEMEYQDHTGNMILELSDGIDNYQFTLDINKKRATLVSLSNNAILDSVTLEENSISQHFHIDYSLIDRQLIVSINDQELFSPVLLPLVNNNSTKLTYQPVRISASGTEWTVSKLRIYRDVYYTGKGRTDGFQLKKDEYYVLGDNSPISFDSRRWKNGAVHKRYFLGKPFIVHLPSKPGKLKIGNNETYIRMPDFQRIRTIR